MGKAAAVVVSAMLVVGAAHAKDLKPCDPTDKPCIVAWWKEYRAGLIEEYRMWAPGLELARRGDKGRAFLFLAAAVREQKSGGQWYRHNNWWRANEEDAEAAGISNEEYEAVDYGCIGAINEIKFALLDASDGKAADVRVQNAVKYGEQCQRAGQTEKKKRR